jgi:hypothetical protein
MSAYVVTVVTNQAELVVCELYASYSLASSRALTLARACAVTNPAWVNPNAPEEKLEDGSVRWTFLETSKFLVTIHFKHVKDYIPTSNQLEELRNNSNFIKFGDTLKVSGTDGTNVQPVTVIQPTVISFTDGYQSPAPIAADPVVATPVVIKDDFYDMSLPAGFSTNGKPITMQDLYDDPYTVASYDTLSINQEWAIAIARVKKRPGFAFAIAAGSLRQQEALDELQKKSVIGEQIKDREIRLLSDVLSESLDESSSSSSDDF